MLIDSKSPLITKNVSTAINPDNITEPLYVCTNYDKIDRMVRKSKRSESWMNLPEKRHLNCASAVSCTFRLSVRLESIALIWHEFHVNNASYQLTLIVRKKTIFSYLCKPKMAAVFAIFHLQQYHFEWKFILSKCILCTLTIVGGAQKIIAGAQQYQSQDCYEKNTWMFELN